MSTNLWLAGTAVVMMTAVLFTPAGTWAADPWQPFVAFSLPSAASFDEASLPERDCPCECPDNEAWYDACPQDSWLVTADALFLQRRDPAGAVLIADAIDDTVILDAGDFDFGGQAGLDFSVARQLGDRWGLEVRYFGVDHWEAFAAASTTPGSLLMANSLPPRNPEAGTGVEAQHSSELHNVEINGHYRLGRSWTLLAGFRYAELDEQFAVGSIGAANPFRYETAARNRLAGFQMGTAVTLWDCGGPLRVAGVGKAGVFGNRAAQRSVWDEAAVLPAVSDRTIETTFLGELGLVASYRLSNHLSLRGGYRLLWIDRVALATDQMAASNFISYQGIDPTGDAFYHGAFVGLQYAR
jgi:hypothetical protein